ncbi:putative mitochondrial acyl-CoA dehydrogenase [Leptomonas pyrrhocoris]|uniref:Short/branched chain specific acyl-CoA dehydrogenase, mitochondrial n=1 Tax=Leptomonas pyrrhocoris TaxID=157538 RepID=A0A0M9GAG9_LEPPY|nr:putative mitochondrial acyl-CoA dehydrogenase [Leptomonas pyrrhocoris]KPA86260.1 putative mitochondrial acyl-CoA dehydrogenase [Leptomonas pyrrhocoris]|eukprot:XP_015664699.1 putative mitochondrial acyl-CoA dehydrogenase [Leptomonas pyrrhocoris]
MFRLASKPLMRRTAVALSAAAVSERPPNPVTYLTDEEKMLASTVRSFSLQHVAPKSRKMDQEGKMDPEVMKEMFSAGLMGIEIPADLEGGGMSFFCSILAIEELARHDAGISVTADVQNTLVNNIFFNFANDAQRKKYLPKLATNTVGCFCLTEAGSGSDAFALKTRAEKKGSKWVINGSKMYVTNGSFAGIHLVMATVDPSKGYKGITCFVVDSSETPGVSVVRTEDKLGIRASSTAELRFENVEVPEENLIGNVGEGYKVAINILNEGRIGIGAQMVGIAQGALDIVMPYLFQRKQFGKVIGEFQGMQMQYAECAMQLHAARLMVYNAARKKQNNENFIQDAAMAKYFSSVVAEKTASRAVEWAGGIGFMKDFGLERFYRDAKIGAIYEGTSIIQLQTIAKLIKAQYDKA